MLYISLGAAVFGIVFGFLTNRKIKLQEVKPKVFLIPLAVSLIGFLVLGKQMVASLVFGWILGFLISLLPEKTEEGFLEASGLISLRYGLGLLFFVGEVVAFNNPVLLAYFCVGLSLSSFRKNKAFLAISLSAFCLGFSGGSDYLIPFCFLGLAIFSFIGTNLFSWFVLKGKASFFPWLKLTITALCFLGFSQQAITLGWSLQDFIFPVLLAGAISTVLEKRLIVMGGFIASLALGGVPSLMIFVSSLIAFSLEKDIPLGLIAFFAFNEQLAASGFSGQVSLANWLVLSGGVLGVGFLRILPFIKDKRNLSFLSVLIMPVLGIILGPRLLLGFIVSTSLFQDEELVEIGTLVSILFAKLMV